MKLPIYFDGSSYLDYKVDRIERITNLYMPLFCISFGKYVTIEKLEYDIAKFQSEKIPILLRITAIVIIVLFAPVTIPLYIIGTVCLNMSNTYQQRLSNYLIKIKFIKTHIKHKSLNCKELKNEIDQIFFLKDPFLSNLIILYTDRKKEQLPEYNNKSSIEILNNLLAEGCCYGQSMNILQILCDSEKREEICENKLYDLITRKDYVYYQILHHLHVFLKNLSFAHPKNNLVYGINLKESIQEIEARLPISKKRKIQSDNFSLNISIEDIKIRLSDFIKQNVPSFEKTTQSTIIQVMFKTHVATIYYDSVNKKYYWYDTYLDDGFFSSTHLSGFLTGVSEKIKLYSKKYSNCYFIAFDLSS